MGQDFRLQLFYMARLLSKKKEKTANASTPGQVLNQLCRKAAGKAAAWIANQNPYTRPPSPLSAQDTVHPTTTNTQNSS